MLIGAVSKRRVAQEDAPPSPPTPPPPLPPTRSKGPKELGSKPCEYLGELCSQRRTASIRTLRYLRNSRESKVRTQQGADSNRFSF